MKLLLTSQALLALITAALSMASEPPYDDDDPNATFTILPITTETQPLTATTATTTTTTATATGPTGPVGVPPIIVPPSKFVTIVTANTAAAPPPPPAEPTAIEKLARREVPAAPEEQAASEEQQDDLPSDPELLAAFEKIMKLAALEEQPAPATSPSTLTARGDDFWDIEENYKYDKYGNRKKKTFPVYAPDAPDPENKKGHKHPTFDNSGAPFCFRWPEEGEGGEPKCPNGDKPTFSWRCTVLNVPFSVEGRKKTYRAERFFKCPGLVKDW